MSLETSYRNTEVVLTQSVSELQKNLIRYLRCLVVITITIYLVSMDMESFIIWTAATLLVSVLIGFWIKTRPLIVMDTSKKYIRIGNSFSFWKGRVIYPKQIMRIVVVQPQARHRGKSKEGGVKGAYLPQLVLRQKDKPNKPDTVDCFPLKDILEAHYVAQLISAFSHIRAYDIQGNVLPTLKSHIPMKYHAGKAPRPERVIATTVRKPRAKARA